MRNICWSPCLNTRLNFDPWRNYAAYFTVKLQLSTKFRGSFHFIFRKGPYFFKGPSRSLLLSHFIIYLLGSYLYVDIIKYMTFFSSSFNIGYKYCCIFWLEMSWNVHLVEYAGQALRPRRGLLQILWKLHLNIVDSSNLGVHVDVVLGHLGHLPHLLRTLAAEHRHLEHHM